jgi:hypothetical protein
VNPISVEFPSGNVIDPKIFSTERARESTIQISETSLSALPELAVPNAQRGKIVLLAPLEYKVGSTLLVDHRAAPTS